MVDFRYSTAGSASDGGSVRINSITIDRSLRIEASQDIVAADDGVSVFAIKREYVISGIISSNSSSVFTPTGTFGTNEFNTLLGKAKAFRVSGYGMLDINVSPTAVQRRGDSIEMAEAIVTKATLRPLSASAVSGNSSYVLTFHVTCMLRPCSDSTFNRNALRYAASYDSSIDTTGVRTDRWSVSAEAITGSTYNLSEVLQRAILIWPKRLGTHRSTSWNVDKSNRRGVFSIVDQDYASNIAYPWGVVSINGTFDVSAVYGVSTPTCNLSLQFTAPKSTTIRNWKRMYADMFYQIQRNYIGYQRDKMNSAPIWMSLQMSNDLYGLDFNASSSWRIASTVQNLAAKSGIGEDWLILQDSKQKWQAHSEFMQAVMNEAVGKHIWDKRTVIVDDCTGIGGNSGTGSISPTSSSSQQGSQTTWMGDPNNFPDQPPSPDKSWLEWNVHVGLRTSNNWSHASIIQEAVGQVDQNLNPSATANLDVRAWKNRQGGFAQSVVGYGGGPKNVVVFSGTLKRAYWPIQRPAIGLFAGQPVYELDSWYDIWQEPSSNGMRVNSMKFVVTYAILTSYGSTESYPNPFVARS